MSINKKILLCFIALVVVGAVSLTLLHRSPKYLEQQQQAQNAQTVHSQDTKLPYDYLNNVIAQSGAACSVYYHSLENDDVFYNYSGKMPAGDLVRLYVAAGVLRQAEDGDLSLDEVYTLREKDRRPGSPVLDKLPAGSRLTVRNLLEDMVLQNDTTALYKLIWIAGREDLNEWLAKQGYADTVVGTAQLPRGENGQDTLAPGEKRQLSYTSVNDTVNLLTRLYQGKCVSPKQDGYLLDLLRKQPARDMLGALLPQKARIAGLQSDQGQVLGAAGIVYAKEKYVLVILMDKAVRPEESRKTLNQISSIIFNTVNDKEVFKK
ncbi:serine hydrolase [Acidaminococcus fermentans]